MDITSVYAGPTSSAAIRSGSSVYFWGTTYIGAPAEDDEPIILDNNPETVVEADADGYYRYDKPRRILSVHYDTVERSSTGSVLLGADSVSCGEYQAAAIAGGRLYFWGDSPNNSRRTNFQFIKFYASEYEQFSNAQAVYCGYGKTAYVLDNENKLWRLTYGEREQMTAEL